MLEKIKIFLMKNSSSEKGMQNLIFFQTITNSDGEFVSQAMKNKENLNTEDEFIFSKKFCIMKNSP